jgi:molecular chaperone HtpG
MSEKKTFQAESQRVLDLMIHSIYTHKEIFLRELISNANDAIDKRYYQAMQSGETGLGRESFEIGLAVDKEARTFTITDNGCGMDEAELENNLGVIAKSGTLDFKKSVGDAADVDVIGQFGVGFYAAFIVADEITVRTKKPGAAHAYRWHSAGADGYTITPDDKEDAGTQITLHIKPSTEEEDYEEFLNPYHITELVKRYSDYIRYPIKMDVPVSRPKTPEKTEEPAQDEAAEDEEKSAEPTAPEWEEVIERQTLNSMTPLWKRGKAEITKEEYETFYTDTFYDYEKPLRIAHTSTDGLISYQALLFIPAKAPYNFYSKDFERGLKLYANGVMIMEHCKDLLPDCFSFVRGLVDSQDLTLNISRETLQHDRQLKSIAKHIEKKIKSELKALMEEDRESYHTFFKAFGPAIKFALYHSYGAQRELLADLIEYPVAVQAEDAAIPAVATFEEYVAQMPEDQTQIYYACAENPARVKSMPQARALLAKGRAILCLPDDVDEFLLKILRNHAEKTFVSIADAAALADEEDKEALAKETEIAKPLLDAMKEALGDAVDEVALTARLGEDAAALSSKGDVSLEMERVMMSQPGHENMPPVKARKVLEISVDAPLYPTLLKLQREQPVRVADYAKLLLGQAQLLEGFALDDPAAFCKLLATLMTNTPAQEG